MWQSSLLRIQIEVRWVYRDAVTRRTHLQASGSRSGGRASIDVI